MGNGQKKKCKLKGSLNIKLKDGQMVKLAEVLYVSQAVKKLLSVSKIVSKGATMGATQEKMTTKKNGVSMTLETRKGQKMSMMFYLKERDTPHKDKRHLPIYQKIK